MSTSVVERDDDSVVSPRWQRLLLSGTVLAPGSGRRTARDWAVDVAMFGAAVSFGVFVLAYSDDKRATWTVAVDIGLGAVACGSLWLRRRFPVGVALLVVACSTVSSLANGAALPALFGVAIRAPLRSLGAIAALTVVETAVYPIVYPGGTNGHGFVWQFTFGVAISAIAMSAGLVVRAQREMLWALRDRAERAEADQLRRMGEAREAERRRIAAEMHDVLAHRLSLLSVQAGAVERWREQLPAPVTPAVGAIRTNARAALDELREVIGVLREPAGDAVISSLTVDRIPGLVEESRQAGLRIESTIDIPADAVISPTIARTAYRVAQESLTNARKHGGGGRVELRVGMAAGELTVEVVSARPLRPAPVSEEARLGAGSGLLGLSERVELAGGFLVYGPDDAGDFVVRATLPLEAS